MTLRSADFKSAASADFAIRALGWRDELNKPNILFYFYPK
jgi:hypothetical protein